MRGLGVAQASQDETVAVLIVILADDDLLFHVAVARLFFLDNRLAAIAVDILLDDRGVLGLYRSRHRHAHDEGGRPYLVSVTSAGRTRLPHSLSISHSGQVASAVVVIGPPPPLPLPAERLQDPDKPAKPPAKQASRSNTLVVTASIVITLVMVTILVFFRHSL